MYSRSAKGGEKGGPNRNPWLAKMSLAMLNTFPECAELRVNLVKTEAIWLGSRRSCHEQLLPDKQLSWNFSGKFKLLGISLICRNLIKHWKIL